MTLVSSAVSVSPSRIVSICKGCYVCDPCEAVSETRIRETPLRCTCECCEMNGKIDRYRKTQAMAGSDTDVSIVSMIREKPYARVGSDAHTRDLAERVSHAHMLTAGKAA